nr:sigma 54-interacting transcriptional regulator [Alkalibaculum sporogenes]
MYKIDNKEIISKDKSQDYNIFSKLVGYDRSLKAIIQLAKAAVIYPPHGLHTIITGPTGVGKSELADCMFEFAITSGNFNSSSPFVVFNAADYAENQQLLLSQLFGHVKGAFTGAENDKVGLVEKANGGILFIDEIHRLPHEGQEILFQIIDKGKLRRLGETKISKDIEVMLISATSEPLDSYLLDTFKRRIPMVIEIPNLNARPLIERYNLIKIFFINEASRIGLSVLVKSDVYKALMLYRCHGNLGQLRSDIQVSCARALLNKLTKKSESVIVNLSDLPDYVMQGLIDIRDCREKVEQYVSNDVMISSTGNSGDLKVNSSIYNFPEEIYRYTEERYLFLMSERLDVKIIDKIVSGEVELKIQQYIKNIKNYITNTDMNELVSIVGNQIVNLTEEIFNIASAKLGKLESNLKYSLAVHFKATIERLKDGKKIQNNNMEEIMLNYPKEFQVAEEVSLYLKDKYNINLPEEEVSVLAIYFNSGHRGDIDNLPKVGVLIIAHGKVATAIAEVANKLMNINHAKAIDMSLDRSPQETLDEAIKASKEMNEGKGVIILVDMGSLAYFGDLIAKETGIEIRTLTRVDTVLAIEVIRRAILPDISIDEITESVINETSYRIEETYDYDISSDYNSKPIILCICVTGDGTAKVLKDKIIYEISDLENQFTIETKGIIEFPRIDLELNRIKKIKKIVTIIGTINPNVYNIPFISAQDILIGEGIDNLKQLTNYNIPQKTVSIKRELNVEDLICEENIYLDLRSCNKDEILDILCSHLIRGNKVRKEFLNDVLNREELFTTELDCGVAIPHADETNVLVPAILIARLEKPILWDKKMISIVVMLAVNKDCFNSFSSILGYIIKPDFLKINDMMTAKEIREALVNACKNIRS